jgi:hypothetical protein
MDIVSIKMDIVSIKKLKKRQWRLRKRKPHLPNKLTNQNYLEEEKHPKSISKGKLQ